MPSNQSYTIQASLLAFHLRRPPEGTLLAVLMEEAKADDKRITKARAKVRLENLKAFCAAIGIDLPKKRGPRAK